MGNIGYIEDQNGNKYELIPSSDERSKFNLYELACTDDHRTIMKKNPNYYPSVQLKLKYPKKKEKLLEFLNEKAQSAEKTSEFEVVKSLIGDEEGFSMDSGVDEKGKSFYYAKRDKKKIKNLLTLLSFFYEKKRIEASFVNGWQHGSIEGLWTRTAHGAYGFVSYFPMEVAKKETTKTLKGSVENKDEKQEGGKVQEIPETPSPDSEFTFFFPDLHFFRELKMDKISGKIKPGNCKPITCEKGNLFDFSWKCTANCKDKKIPDKLIIPGLKPI